MNDLSKLKEALRFNDDDDNNSDDNNDNDDDIEDADYEMDTDDLSTKLASFIQARQRLLTANTTIDNKNNSIVDFNVICGMKAKKQQGQQQQQQSNAIRISDGGVDMNALLASELRFAVARLRDRKDEQYARQEEGAVNH